MNGALVVLGLVLLFMQCSSSLELDPNPNPNSDAKAISNITVIGTVFCDACCDSTFSKHSYFISGAQVRINCNFRVNSTSHAEISITADKTTDQYGIYRLDIPPIDRLECKVGREIDSFCRASLIGSSPSSLCNVPAMTASSEHVSVREPQTDACVYNLNALYYRPEKNVTICSGKTDTKHNPFNTSLFFWPPLFQWPWQHSPSFPFPFPSPPSFPIPLPFFTPPPPFWQFPLPPIPFFTPPPPPPFLHLPPLPFFTQPPPSFTFPFPFPPWGKSPTPPPPPPPSFPFPLPPLPPIFTPSLPPPPPPSPPPPSFSFPIPHFPPITSWFAPPPPPPPPPSPPPPPPTFHFPFPPIQFPPFPPLSPTPDTPAPPPVS